jgi:hypothetical protein
MSWLITGSEKTPVDPVFNNVSLLLHGNGTNGSTTITDSSPSPKTVTAVGNAQISTAQSKFGGASIAFDGNGDNLQVGASSAFNFDNLPFTVETFIYLGAGFNATGTIFSQRAGGGPSFRVEPSRAIRAFTGGANLGDDITSSNALSLETWTHVACTRQNNTFTLWINGVSSGTSATYAGSMPSGVITEIGVRSSVEYLNGYIDDLRITKGIARYTANFTPPTAPFPDI